MNHAKVSFKADIAPKVVEALLIELVKAKWPDGVVVLTCEAPTRWHITSPLSEVFGMAVWVRSPRCLEMRKGGGDLNSWLQGYIQENLALRLKGRCSDEGAIGTWAPDPDPFKTYKTYFYHSLGGWSDHPAPSADALWAKMGAQGLLPWARTIVYDEKGELR